jgi:aquaporin Z
MHSRRCAAHSLAAAQRWLDPAWQGSIGTPALGSGVGSAFLAEVVLTFALVHTVLCVATTTSQANNSYFGLAIGFTVLSSSISVGGISGGAFNPAVAMLPLLLDESASRNDVWVWIIGPLVGGALAGGALN